MCSYTENQLELVRSDVRREIDCYLIKRVCERVLSELHVIFLSVLTTYFAIGVPRTAVTTTSTVTTDSTTTLTLSPHP